LVVTLELLRLPVLRERPPLLRVRLTAEFLCLLGLRREAEA
jgi:hypothetical protein